MSTTYMHNIQVHYSTNTIENSIILRIVAYEVLM